MPFDIHALYRQIFKRWRRKRFRLFLSLVAPAASDTLLDVGGYPGLWASQAQPLARIDTLNIEPVDGTAVPAGCPIRALQGDGCNLPFADRSYDIGYSNSVIEHVGSWERQQRFAAEIRRVAGALWVQTPAYECPLEPHYLAPLVHYLPRSVQKRLLRWCSVWGWVERPSREQVNRMVDTTRLLRREEMRRLFPDCEILTERLFGVVPKSYIAFRLKPRP